MTFLTKQLLLIFTATLLFVTNLLGQQLYPGDVNNNGTVNVVDLLHLGVAYGATGPQRVDDGTEWEAKTYTPWAQDFPDGLNYAFADCDGNGEVEDDDITNAIEENYALEHGTLQADGFNINGTPATSPILQLIPNTDIVIEGNTVTFDVVLGSEAIPVQNFYGIAFTMSYDDDLTQNEDQITFELANNAWIDPSNGNDSRSISVFKETGQAGIAITRINQQEIEDGFGVIGSFSIVIEDDIASSVMDTLNISIDSIKLTGFDLDAIDMVPTDTFVVVEKDPTHTTSAINDIELITLSPNPTSDYLLVESTSPFKKVCIFNIFGEKIYAQNHQNKRLSQKLDVSSRYYANGVYFIYLETENGRLTKPFVLQN